MTEKQYEVNELVEKFSTLKCGDTVRLTTDAGSLSCEVAAVEMSDEHAELRLERAKGEADLRIYAKWVKGWLDPLVDVVPTEDGRREPLGTLYELDVVAECIRSGKP